MPRLPKPRELRQNRERQDFGIVVAMPREVPEPPKGLLKETAQAWRDFWGSALSSTVQLDTDMPALTRLWDLYDRRARANKEASGHMLVEGSMGQKVLNPLLKLVKDLDGEIRQMEDRFGLTPQARLKLGVAFGQAQDSLEAINRRLSERNSDPDQEEDEDPRIIDITPSNSG